MSLTGSEIVIIQNPVSSTEKSPNFSVKNAHTQKQKSNFLRIFISFLKNKLQATNQKK
jgi:hypothetical protein